MRASMSADPETQRHQRTLPIIDHGFSTQDACTQGVRGGQCGCKKGPRNTRQFTDTFKGNPYTRTYIEKLLPNYITKEYWT